MKRKIVISINSTWNIYNFRAGLIGVLVEAGYDVVALAPEDEYSDRLKTLGCTVIHLPMDNNGTHLGRDLMLLSRYYLLLRTLRPHAFLGYTVKPNIYGSLAAHALGIPVINNIAGLGSTFIRKSFVTKIVKILYKLALARSHKVFFQNLDDQALFNEIGLVRQGVSSLLPGSGLNLNHYVPSPVADQAQQPFRFLLVARMLKDKGIEEYVQAAKLIHHKGLEVEFQLLGAIGTGNPNAISAEKLDEWQRNGIVTYLGKTDDVRPYLSAADCVVLPSYREGVPRALLEAAAMARPIIATDVVGCRDVVDDGLNGMLCEEKSATSLAEKMGAMVALSLAERVAMGAAGRRKVEAQFDEKIVIKKYLKALDAIVKPVAIQTDMEEFAAERINS